MPTIGLEGVGGVGSSLSLSSSPHEVTKTEKIMHIIMYRGKRVNFFTIVVSVEQLVKLYPNNVAPFHLRIFHRSPNGKIDKKRIA